MRRYFIISNIVLSALVVVASLFNIAMAAETDTPPKKQTVELGTLTAQFENDLFAGTDQHYTNGVRFSWLSPRGDSLDEINMVREFLENIAMDENDDYTRFGLALGQEIYTPENRLSENVTSADRPYAGWVYGAMSLHTVSQWTMNTDFLDLETKGQTLESVELQLGIVGPQSYGKQTQDFIHDLRLIDRFEGWGNQLRNEPGVMLMYERKWRFGDPIEIGPKGLMADFIPHIGVSAGNILTHANIGGVFRYGYQLPSDFGPPSLIKGVFPLDTMRHQRISAYLFAGAEGRGVARNIFLDGNSFTDSHSVDKKTWVGDAVIGVALMVGRFRLSYASAFRTREFKDQKSSSRFGSLSASFQAPF